ncbi:hypothetical protein GGR50DRAFT_500282 [Xylaria sp. CBS 124048]|nr:hypothetical protein GGR50DRAFT_500282 [Xylaria sp. CBS 124048]
MASITFSSEIPFYHHHRRDSASSNKSIGSRRPRLLRAYITPSITTEIACSGLLTSPMCSTRRAAELLSRVALSSGSISPTNTSSSRSPTEIPTERLAQTNQESYTACYFSFPSPDTWDEQSQDDKEIESGSP